MNLHTNVAAAVDNINMDALRSHPLYGFLGQPGEEAARLIAEIDAARDMLGPSDINRGSIELLGWLTEHMHARVSKLFNDPERITALPLVITALRTRLSKQEFTSVMSTTPAGMASLVDRLVQHPVTHNVALDALQAGARSSDSKSLSVAEEHGRDDLTNALHRSTVSQ